MLTNILLAVSGLGMMSLLYVRSGMKTSTAIGLAVVSPFPYAGIMGLAPGPGIVLVLTLLCLALPVMAIATDFASKSPVSVWARRRWPSTFGVMKPLVRGDPMFIVMCLLGICFGLLLLLRITDDANRFRRTHERAFVRAILVSKLACSGHDEQAASENSVARPGSSQLGSTSSWTQASVL